MTADLPTELALVVACCRWPPSLSRIDAVRAAASQPIDWDAFERVVSRHRVVGLVHEGLHQAKIEVTPGLRARLVKSVLVAGYTALAMGRETLRLQEVFDEAGLPNLSVKGPGLAPLAYGTLGIKQSSDIDLLITPDSAAAARRLLVKLGYEVSMPGEFGNVRAFNDLKFARFVQFAQEAGFLNSTLNVRVDLHWRLDNNSVLLPGVSALSETQAVGLANRGLRTLKDDELFAYLCVHGARHGWARLKWLADLNAFLARREPTQIEQLYRHAVNLEARRPAGAALLLCRKLLGLTLPDRLLGELCADPFVRQLMANSLHCITYRRGEAEFSRYTTAGMRVFFSHFILASKPDYFWKEMHRKLVHPVDAARIMLPQRLTFLFYLLRFPMWLWRNAKRAIGNWIAR